MDFLNTDFIPVPMTYKGLVTVLWPLTESGMPPTFFGVA